ncbi:MAG: hypothetical protein R3F50_02685 [Gammaproteobacteria bacterium]
MPLLSDSLSIWDIAHRWAGYDPDSYRIKLPLLAKDYARLLVKAVLNGEVFCETLTLAKRPSDSKADPRFYIRTHLDDVYACIHGVRYNRKLLQWASISRQEFQEWCESMAIPLPEFWFPPGWKYSFEMPEFGTRAFWAQHQEPDEPDGFSLVFRLPEESSGEDSQPSPSTEEAIPTRASQIAKLCAQQMATQLWKEHPDRTITAMADDEVIRRYSGASHYDARTVRKWLGEVAPVNVKKKGRPRGKNSDEQPD